MREYIERRLYFSGRCEKCGNGFQSFKRSRIKHGLCRKCRKNWVDPNQTSLFEGHTIEETKDRLVEKIKGVPFLVIGKT